MTRFILIVTLGLLVLASPALAQCTAGMVESGSTCIDKYEASLWKITDERCIKSIKDGKDPTPQCLAAAVQVGINGIDYTDGQCQFNGGGCKNIFALSLPAVVPARSVNYFIAAAACRNSNKRLPSGAEWQAAALGTPDPWPQDDPANQCNLSSPSVAHTIAFTGAHSLCVSDVGAFDMVGNVIELLPTGAAGDGGRTGTCSFLASAAM